MLGKACCTIAVGIVDNLGYLLGNEPVRKKLRLSKAYMVTERDILEAVAAAMTVSAHGGDGNGNGHAQPKGVLAQTFVARNHFLTGLATVVPINHPDCRAFWRRDARQGVYCNVNSAGVRVRARHGVQRRAKAATRKSAGRRGRATRGRDGQDAGARDREEAV